MEKRKSSIKKGSNAKKNAFLRSGLKASKKQCIKVKLKNDFDDTESDVFLRDIKPNKKFLGLDERIKSLKSDLKSLLGDKQLDPDVSSNSKSSNASSNCHEKLEEVKLKEADIYETKDFEPSFKSTPSKVSVWLDKTIDLLDSKSGTPQGDASVSFNSKCPTILNSTLVADEIESEPLFPQHKVEELIYKSFCLQYSELFLSNVEISATKRNNCKRKHQTDSTSKRAKQKCKRVNKSEKTASKKRPVDSDVEVINIDDKTQGTTAVCVDLDVSNYNWDESFELDEATGFLSDVQIINEINKKCDDESKKSITDLTESEKSVFQDNNAKTPSRKNWECPVCFETNQGQEIVATQCGHVFCRKCIENHISQIKNCCPACRCSLKDKPLITLFNF